METGSLTLHESHSRNGQTVLDLRPRPLQFEGRDVDTLIREAREIERRLWQGREEKLTREDLLQVATEEEADTLEAAWDVPYHSELRGRIVIDGDVQATASGATDGLRQRLRKRTGISRETHYVWVDGAEKVSGRIELPSRYDKVFVATGNAADPEVTVLTGHETQRPYYRIEGGKTVIYMDGFSGGGGANVWRVPSDDDFKAIEMHLGMSEAEADSTGYRGTDEGSALAGEADLWSSGDLKSNARFGESGFDGLPAGWRSSSGSFLSEGTLGSFWSSSVSDGSAWWRDLGYSSSEVFRSAGSQGIGFSLRCLRDDSSSDTDGTVYTDDYEGNDGKKYDAVKIGDFVVINKNLDETKYADGTDIPEITNNTDWENDTDGARCYYDNDESTYGSTYGALYNWYAVDNAAGIVAPQEATEATLYVNQGGTAVPASVKVRIGGTATPATLKVK